MQSLMVYKHVSSTLLIYFAVLSSKTWFQNFLHLSFHLTMYKSSETNRPAVEDHLDVEVPSGRFLRHVQSMTPFDKTTLVGVNVGALYSFREHWDHMLSDGFMVSDLL